MFLKVHGRALALLALSPAGLALSTPALAQDSADADDAVVDEIVVTSSRIRRPEESVSNPVVAIEAEAIRNSGATNLSNYLKELPALVGSLDANDAAGSNTFIGGTGLSLLNLRNLGVDRTLVLVDGRRHVASLPGSAAVDVDTIPIALVDRIDVQTGGASAIYGADGVSGVVNFVMKKNFEGVDARAQIGRSDHGDADQRIFSVAAGQNFAEDRGNFTFALEYATEDRLHSSRRSFARSNRASFMMNPDDLDDDPNLPDRVPITDVRFNDSSPDGAVWIFDENGDFYDLYNGTDRPFDFGTIDYIPPYYQQGGDGTPTAGYIGDLLPEVKRYTGNLSASFELSPSARLFGEFKHSQSQSFSISSPSFDFYLWVPEDNAYLPPNIAAAVADSNGGGVYVSRDHFDLGLRDERIDRKTTRAVVGIEGDITSNIRYEASYVYGESKIKNLAGNNRYNDRFAAALDAVIDPDTGQAVCRSNLDPTAEPDNISWMEWDAYDPLPGTWAGSFTPGPDSGCVPVNIFGNGSVSEAAAAWIMTDSLSLSKIEQQVVQAYISGDTSDWFELPAGALGFAVGAEWREEKSSSTPPEEDAAGLTFGNILLPVVGRYDVKEVFTEVNVPLLKNAPFAELLSLDGALRFSDYSTTGDATTWKLGLIWSPISDIAFRATYAEATRAPNIGELFDPGGQDFEGIDDPCDVNRLDEGSATRAANCAALLSQFGVDPTTFVDQNSATIAGVSRGNPDLEEEVAETTTVGVVFRPRFLPNFSLSVDWYDIKLTNAIATASAEEAAQICVDSPSLDNDFCALTQRSSTTGQIVGFLQSPLNVASFTTEGYDFTMNYGFAPAAGRWGDFNLRVVGNKLKDLTYINLPGSEPDPELGEADAPEWQGNADLTWELDAVLVNYGVNYMDKTYRYAFQQRRADPDLVAPQYRKYDAKLTHDVQVRYSLANGLAVYGGVNNLTNQKPDIGAVFYPVSAVGRYWYVGATFNGF